MDLSFMGIDIDETKNEIRGEEQKISTDASKVQVWVVPTNEELAIARETVCTNPQVTAGNKYYFRTTFMDPFQGRVIASYAAEQGYRTAAVISQNGDDYSTGIAAYFRQAFTDEKIGGKVVADEAYHAGETEFDEILQKIQKTNPDCI